MTRDEWQRVETLFSEACEQPAATRLAWLHGACDDASVRTLVREMLEAHETDPAFLETASDLSAVAEAAAEGLVGRRVGAYRVTRQVGQGGMGVVYEAVRDDDDFARRVAVKVLPPWSGVAGLDRFRRERRVLATLDHPGIARLLDSGTTPDGAPFFVMEFVDGRPIDAWCHEHAVPLRERVALLVRVADAVADAHRHLVIHRDLKPANILVQADGQPKLLDFGIATVVSDEGDGAGRTQTGDRYFTPEFASPEQVRGEPVTTASDVYGLGALLFVLVAGRRPHRLHGTSPLEAMRLVCEVDPPPPSTVADQADAPAIRGALDAIVRKAMRRDSRERYATVAELAADLRAWLAGLPVTAAPESIGQQVARVVRRHRVGVTAAAAVVVALVAGGGVAIWQGRIAAAERDKARDRLRQVGQFSRSLLFDVNDRLADVPGNLDVRRLLLERATQFLDGFSADADADALLAGELVEAYRRLGRVQGDAQSQNLGDSGAAVASFAKAAALAERLATSAPRDVRRIGDAMETLDELERALADRGDTAGASAAAARHVAWLERLEREHAADPSARAIAAMGYSDDGLRKATVGDFAAARQRYARAVELFESLPAADRQRASTAAQEAFALKRLGAVTQMLGDLPEAERRYRAALAIEEGVLAAQPGGPEQAYALTFTLSDLGSVVRARAAVEEAKALWIRAMTVRQRALDANPGDRRAAGGVATLAGRLGMLAIEEGRLDEAVLLFRRALALRESLVAGADPAPRPSAELAWARLLIAQTLVRQAESGTAAATGARREARRLLQGLAPAAVTVDTTHGSPEDFRGALAEWRRRAG